MKENNGYSSYDFDSLKEGSELTVKHSVYCNKDCDISDLISKPVIEIITMRSESVEAEKAAFEKVRQAAAEWEKQAAVTQRLDRAMEYLKTPEVKHTSNKWQKDQYGNFDIISNKVYKMSYRIYDYHSRNGGNRFEVQWSLCTNSPVNSGTIRIAGQDKSYTNIAEAEKYMQGRIKAYAHLFTEISPPVPKEYAASFRVRGQLLPGYTIEGEQPQKQENVRADKKSSIRQELNSLKAADKEKSVPTKAKKRDNQEIG